MFGSIEADGYWGGNSLQIKRKLANTGEVRVRNYRIADLTWSSLNRFMRVVIDSDMFEILNYADANYRYHEFKRKS